MAGAHRCIASQTRPGVIGSWCTRAPVTLAIALAIAPGVGTQGGSPMPFEPFGPPSWVGASTNAIGIGGASPPSAACSRAGGGSAAGRPRRPASPRAAPCRCPSRRRPRPGPRRRSGSGCGRVVRPRPPPARGTTPVSRSTLTRTAWVMNVGASERLHAQPAGAAGGVDVGRRAAACRSRWPSSSLSPWAVSASVRDRDRLGRRALDAGDAVDQLDVVAARLELLRGQVEQLLAHLARGLRSPPGRC